MYTFKQHISRIGTEMYLLLVKCFEKQLLFLRCHTATGLLSCCCHVLWDDVHTDILHAAFKTPFGY